MCLEERSVSALMTNEDVRVIPPSLASGLGDLSSFAEASSLVLPQQVMD